MEEEITLEALVRMVQVGFLELRRECQHDSRSLERKVDEGFAMIGDRLETIESAVKVRNF